MKLTQKLCFSSLGVVSLQQAAMQIPSFQNSGCEPYNSRINSLSDVVLLERLLANTSEMGLNFNVAPHCQLSRIHLACMLSLNAHTGSSG
jgi:hypothetical protein